MVKFLKGYSGIARLEYLPAEGPALLIPIFLGLTSLYQVFEIRVIEAILVFTLLYFSGFIINSLQDIEADKGNKPHVSDAVESLGAGTVKLILAGHLAAAFLLSAHLALTVGNPWLIVLVALGVFFGLGYSIEPLMFKTKGVWHIISLSLSAFLIPFLFLYYAIALTIEPPILVAMMGFATGHYAIALANQSGDFREDGKMGLTTPAVKWGLSRTLRYAIYFSVFGVIILGMGLVWILSAVPLADTVGLGMLPDVVIAALLTGVFLTVGYYTPVKGLLDIHRMSRSKVAMDPKMDAIKKRLNYPIWQASGIMGILGVSVLFFGVRLLALA